MKKIYIYNYNNNNNNTLRTVKWERKAWAFKQVGSAVSLSSLPPDFLLHEIMKYLYFFKPMIIFCYLQLKTIYLRIWYFLTVKTIIIEEREVRAHANLQSSENECS